MKFVLLGMILVFASCAGNTPSAGTRTRSVVPTSAESAGKPPVMAAENLTPDDAGPSIPGETGPDRPILPPVGGDEAVIECETEIAVTEEVYRTTLSEIDELLQELTGAIRTGDYRLWLTYLSEEYKHKYDNPVVLADLSESPTLKDNNLMLRSLGDYFRYVVMPSRKGSVRIDRIVFTHPDRLKVVMLIEGLPVILYTMRKENGIWKVTVE